MCRSPRNSGYKIRAHDIDDSKLVAIREHGGIDVEGDEGGFAVVEQASTELAAAIDGAGIILVITGGHRQEAAAEVLAPLLQDGQLILLIQGNTGGSFAFRKTLNDAGCGANVDIAEMDNFPFSAPRLSPTKMRPKVTKQWLQIAAFPGNRIGGSVFAVVVTLSDCGASQEYPAYGFYQCERDASRCKLRRQRD